MTASAIGMVFIQYERCSHVKILLLLYVVHEEGIMSFSHSRMTYVRTFEECSGPSWL